MTRAHARFVSLVIGALAASPAGAFAQTPALRVVELVTATSDVHDAAVDGGRLLLATSGGLVVRSGASGGAPLQVLTTRDGLPGTRLRSVSVTASGTWVGAIEGAALVRWDASGHAVVERTVPLARVTRVVDWQGDTWLATYGAGLYRARAGAAPARVALGDHPHLVHVTDLVAQGDSMWVATAGAGLVELGRDGRVRGRLRRGNGLADDIVWSLEARSAANGEELVVATAAGVSIVRDRSVVPRAPEGAASTALAVRDVRATLSTAEGVWIATFGAGLWRVRPGERRAIRVTPDDGRTLERIRALCRVGGDVVAAHDGGAHVVAAGGGRVRAVEMGGLPSSDVTALAVAFGSLWIGTFDHGLARFEERRVVRVSRALERWGMDRRINDLAVTRDGHRETLWIATDRGLYEHDGRSFTPVVDRGAPERAHTTSLHVDRDGALWVASSRALARFDGSRWQSWSGTGDARLPVAQLGSVTTDARGDVWVGSLHGLLRFDPRTARFERHSVSTGALPVDWVTAVLPWGRGVVAGTYHGGLVFGDGGGAGSAQRFRRDAQGEWVNPNALATVGGELWVGTLERGLVVGRPGAWRRLELRDGLPSADVTRIVRADDDSAWVATRGGIARVAWR